MYTARLQTARRPSACKYRVHSQFISYHVHTCTRPDSTRRGGHLPVNVYAYMYTYVHTHVGIFMYVHERIYAPIHTCTQAHTHTHLHSIRAQNAPEHKIIFAPLLQRPRLVYSRNRRLLNPRRRAMRGQYHSWSGARICSGGVRSH